MDWASLQGEIRGTAVAVGKHLVEVPAGASLRRVTWSAPEVGAHLVSLADRYSAMIERPVPFPASLAADNRQAIDAIPERDPAALAAMLTERVNAFLAALGPRGSREVHYFSEPLPASGLGGIMLNELLIHGWDIADAAGLTWTIGREQAVTALKGVLRAIVLAADPAVAATAEGVYHLHLRHGDDWTFTVADGQVTTDMVKPDNPDLHVSADPVAFLRTGFGLMSHTQAVLTGRIIAYGRRPGLAFKFSKLFAET